MIEYPKHLLAEMEQTLRHACMEAQKNGYKILPGPFEGKEQCCPLGALHKLKHPNCDSKLSWRHIHCAMEYLKISDKEAWAFVAGFENDYQEGENPINQPTKYYKYIKPTDFLLSNKERQLFNLGVVLRREFK